MSSPHLLRTYFGEEPASAKSRLVPKQDIVVRSLHKESHFSPPCKIRSKFDKNLPRNSSGFGTLQKCWQKLLECRQSYRKFRNVTGSKKNCEKIAKKLSRRFFLMKSVQNMCTIVPKWSEFAHLVWISIFLYFPFDSILPAFFWDTFSEMSSVHI